MKGQVTIKDIAKALDISPSTVSRALKDHPDISQKTKQAVKQLAEELNYQPNAIALNLRQSRTHTIGVIIPEIVHFFFSTIISGIEDVAYEAGYSVIVSQSNESLEREKMDTKALFNNRVDGMLISMSRETTEFEHFEGIFKKGMPMVFFDRVCDVLDTSRVIVDDFDGAFQATEHLIKNGYKRIAHLGGPLSLSISKKRFQGYKAALEKHNIAIDDSLVLSDNSFEDVENATEMTNMLLDMKKPPDSLFAINDNAALGAMIAVKQHKLKIPEEFGVVGFSNWRFTTLTEPPLTTVDQPGFAMGQEAARLLIKEIESDDDAVVKPETITLKTDLIVRESSNRK